MRIPACLLLALAPFAVPMQVQAQPAPPVGRFHLGIDLGVTQPQETAQLRDPNGHLAIGARFGRRQSRHLAWDVDYLTYGYSFDRLAGIGSLPPITVTDGRATARVSTLSGTLRLVAPLGAFEPFAGAGLGYYRAKISVSGLQFAVIPVDVSRADSGLGTHLVLGADYRYGANAAWGVRYRKSFFKASFGPEIPGEADMGAGVLTLSFQRTF